MSFKQVQTEMAKGGVGMERAGAMLASRTRKIMAKHGMSAKHGIPKNVFQRMKRKKKDVNKMIAEAKASK